MFWTSLNYWADYLDTERMARNDLFLLVTMRLQDIKPDKNYFKSVGKESWKLETDEKDITGVRETWP